MKCAYFCTQKRIVLERFVKSGFIFTNFERGLEDSVLDIGPFWQRDGLSLLGVEFSNTNVKNEYKMKIKKSPALADYFAEHSPKNSARAYIL